MTGITITEVIGEQITPFFSLLGEIESGRHFSESKPTHRAWLERKIKARTACGTRFFAAHNASGAPVGIVGILLENKLFCEPHSELVDIGVVAAHRRRGIGSRLLIHAVNFANRNGATVVTLTTYAADGGAIAFYEHNAFHSVAVIPGTNGPEDAGDVVMQRSLSNQPVQAPRCGASDGRRSEHDEMRAPFQILVIPFRRTAAGPEFAVLKRSDAGWWQFVAGGGEDDELPQEAAERETEEEIGITANGHLIQLDSVATIPKDCFVAADSWGQGVYVIPEYCFAVDAGDRALTLSSEHTDSRWVPYDRACCLLKWDSNRNALWELNERLKRIPGRQVGGTAVRGA